MDNSRTLRDRIAKILEEETKAIFDTDKDPEAVSTSGTGPTEKAGTGKDTEPTIGKKLGKTGKAEH